MHITNELKPYVRDQKGCWSKKTRWDFITGGLCAAIILGAYIAHINNAGSNGRNIINEVRAAGVQESSDSEKTCIRDEDGSCKWVMSNKSENELLREWNAWLEEKLEKLNKKVVTASISMYSRVDSCHFPKGNLCLTAIGRDTKEGVTVACPRHIPLGTKVFIEGFGMRVCEDRYAEFVQKQHGDTYDVFTESHEVAIQFGRRNLQVSILK